MDRATAITVDIIVALSVLYFAVTYVMLLTKLRGYRKLPYTFVQVGLVYNTLQVSPHSLLHQKPLVVAIKLSV